MYKEKTTGNDALGIQVKFCGLAVTLLLKRKRRRDFFFRKRREGRKKDERDKEGEKTKKRESKQWNALWELSRAALPFSFTGVIQKSEIT